MSWLSEFMHPQRPYQAAQDEARKYHQQARGYHQEARGMQQPFVEQGQQAGGILSDAMQQLTHPQQMHSDLMSGYEMSPEAQIAQQQAQQQGLEAASSMGLMGSQPALQAIQGGASRIGAQDRHQYLQDLLGMYHQGTGLAHDMYGTGAQMAGQMGQQSMHMGDQAMQMGDTMGTLSAGQHSAPGRLFGGIGGAVTGLAGAALGGPIGTAVGGKLGQMMNVKPEMMQGSQPWRTGGY